MKKELGTDVRRRRGEIVSSITNWGRQNIREFPWRVNRTPYNILVAEIILRRTTASAGTRVYEQFISIYPDIEAIANADVKVIEDLLLTVGYNKQRARIIKDMALYIIEKYGGEIPNNKDDLLNIPHIGPYTAAAILSLGYGVPAAMVDSNTYRIYSRIFADRLPERPPYKDVLEIAEKILPKSKHQFFNLVLLDFGAIVCRYAYPKHNICPLAKICDSSGK